MVMGALLIERPLWFFVSLGAEIYINRTAYYSIIDGQTIEIYNSWVAQPKILAGFAVGFF